MSTQYECLKSADLYAEAFGVAPPETLTGKQVWPRQPGFFIRKAASASSVMAEVDASSEASANRLVLELTQGQFGLVPTWVKSASDAKLRSTKLAVTRYETMSTATPTRETWLNGQRCIIPMQAFLEDDWRSGKAVPTRIARVDGKPMGVAGLWEHWAKDGESITSFTLLTVNANSHALMNRYGQNGNEKRMPAILNEGSWAAWLSAPVDKAREFMRAYPAHLLLANPVQKK
ncbi:SOS response-associated peptidase family protein [Limnohabitans sp. DM1]|uniref:SOS response-associated peptidase family protein n=1 Tax=Limnohabitans sp. DM1 TaxID=1597955 RepID=UPI000B3167F6|nr:SOS response-associated peptidase family protein [Limnohabitans sp. DM1]